MPDIQSHHEQVIDGLLDELSPEQIFFRLHERKRKKDHAAAKAAQPTVEVAISDDDWADVMRDLLRPLDDSDKNPQGIDYLVQTVLDCVAREDRTDTFFAAMRLVRRVWALQPHLGPVQLPWGASPKGDV